MRLQANYQIWKCADKPDGPRPMLGVVRIELDPTAPPITYQEWQANGGLITKQSVDRWGLAIASDGQRLAIVPCVIELGDQVPVNVDVKAFQLARKKALALRPLKYKKDPTLEWSCMLEEEGLMMVGGELLPSELAYVKGPYADWRMIVNWLGAPPDNYNQPTRSAEPLGLFVDDLVAIQHALGIGEGTDRSGVIITARHINGLVLVEPPATPYPRPPFAVVMPFYRQLPDRNQLMARFPQPEVAT